METYLFWKFRMKICLFGGAFDPLHLGHENIIKTLLLKFDKVILMPSKQSLDKDMPIASELHRLKMLSLCDSASNPNLIIDDYELKSNDRLSFTINSIKYIKNKFQEYDLYLALGYDQLINLPNWYKSSLLLEMVKIICFNRSQLIDKKKPLIDYDLIEDFNYDISSSKIKKIIQTDCSKVKDMVSKKIFNYMIEERVY